MFQVDCSFQLWLGLISVVGEHVALRVTALKEHHPPLPPPRLEQDGGSLLGRRLGEPARVDDGEGLAQVHAETLAGQHCKVWRNVILLDRESAGEFCDHNTNKGFIIHQRNARNVCYLGSPNRFTSSPGSIFSCILVCLVRPAVLSRQAATDINTELPRHCLASPQYKPDILVVAGAGTTYS